MRTETAEKLDHDTGEFVEFTYQVPETEAEREEMEQKQEDGDVAEPMNLATNLEEGENDN